MRRDSAALTGRTFDLLVIGGGILGAGVARDAAMRGLSVALIDKADFASGTSSRSSKLIHGGFRYLEQLEFGLVAEGCRERRILQDIAPHLVRPLPFLLPVYDGDPRPLPLMRLGMTLYDLLARYRNAAPHQGLDVLDVADVEPGLRREGLTGAIRYYDCQEDDARLCLDTLLHAADLGAVCTNYCEVMGFETHDGTIVAARVVDRASRDRQGAGFCGPTDRSHTVAARTDGLLVRAWVVVNAAGPWVERVAELAPPSDGANNHSLRLGPTKGVHLLLPRLTRDHAIAFQGGRDGRIMFLMPWHDGTLVGTTDTDYRGSLDDVRTTSADVAYLLAEVRRIIPAASALTGSDVITAFAGLRPLLKADAAAPSARSREHRLVRQGANLLTVAGGKYTTYRAIAAEVTDEVYRLLGDQHPPACRTAETLIPDPRPAPAGARLADCPAVYESDVAAACDAEAAVTVADVMRRRTGLALSRFGGADVAEVVSRAMAGRMGWDEAARAAGVCEYLDDRARELPFPGIG